MRIILLITLIFARLALMDAQEITILGKIRDNDSQKPVPYAVVLIKGTKVSVNADENGYFELKSKSLPVTFVIFNFGFFTEEMAVNNKEPIIINLMRKEFLLNEVNIVANKIDTFQANNRTVFLAFEFFDNLTVALINKGGKNNIVQVMDEQGKILKEKKAPNGVESMYKDCLGNIQLLSDLYFYQFFYNYEDIIFMEKFEIGDFYSKVYPCQCVFGNYFYFREIFYKNLKHRYFYVSKSNRTDRRLIGEIFDKGLIDMFNKDYDINYFLAQRRSGAGYSTSVDELSKHLEELRESVPISQSYAGKLIPAESEMVKRDSCLLLIDYTNKHFLKYNFLGKLIEKDTIRLNQLVPKSLVDVDNNNLYIVTESKGKITLHDYTQSKISIKKIPIDEFVFIKNLRCRNGYLYFLYRNPLEQNTNPKIYKYRLN